MDIDLIQLINTFRQLRVLVIGEAMLDTYLEGPTAGICREAPVPTVIVDTRRDVAGGAANTAFNIARLGATSIFISVIGDDPEGQRLRAVLNAGGVDTQFIIAGPARKTIAKHRVIADAQLLVRFDQGGVDAVNPEIEEELLAHLSRIFPQVHAVIVSDYACGVLTPRVIAHLARLQAQHPRILVVDSKRLTAYREVALTAIKPNYEEARRLLDLSPKTYSEPRAQAMMHYGQRILDIVNAAVTLDTDGAILFERGSPPFRTYGKMVQPSKAAGAGDTFVSAFTLTLATGAGATTAAEIASAAAGVAVGKDGTANCSDIELREYFTGGNKYIRDQERLRSRIEVYRRQKKRVVFTNGCFDILHRGHITHLSRAKALGDILIVGLNSDESIRRLKGENRPINSLEDRIQILGALSCIDHIVSFDEDSPQQLIRLIKPAIYVKGGDYTRELLPEVALVENLGGEVKILSYLPNFSTSRIIERIREAAPQEEQAISLQSGTYDGTQPMALRK